MTQQDKTEFRIGRSHDDCVYHHVEGRDYRLDPRYAVCMYGSEAETVMKALNLYVSHNRLTQADFEELGLRW